MRKEVEMAKENFTDGDWKKKQLNPQDLIIESGDQRFEIDKNIKMTSVSLMINNSKITLPPGKYKFSVSDNLSVRIEKEI